MALVSALLVVQSALVQGVTLQFRPAGGGRGRAGAERCCEEVVPAEWRRVGGYAQWKNTGGMDPWTQEFIREPKVEEIIQASEREDYLTKLRRRWLTPLPVQDYAWVGRPVNTSIENLLHLQPRYASRDWARNILTLPMSRILRRIVSPLAFNFVVSSACLLFHRSVGLPLISSTAHTLLGSALGLLLVFRTNTAYDRYWEVLSPT